MLNKWIIFLLVNRVVHNVLFWEWRFFSKLLAFAYFIFYAFIYFLDIFFGCVFLFKNNFLNLCNGVYFLVFFNLFFCSVMLCITHRVSSITIRLQLQECWSITTTCTLYGFVKSFCHFYRIHTINWSARHLVT